MLHPPKYGYLLLLLIAGACTRYDEEVIPGNAAPPDHTISAAVYESYINKSYILSMGREPDSAEMNFSFSLLEDAGMSETARMIFADSVFADADYRYHTYEEHRFALLASSDSAEAAQMILTFTFFLNDSNYSMLWPVLTFEISRLNELLNAKNLFAQDSISIIEVHRRMVNNYFYDQLNMGSQNFVLGVFQQLLNRQPTQNELASGVAMVDGNNSVIFLQSGNSKDDFLDIVLHSDSYYEGQVIRLYEKYLLRTPSTQEMTTGMLNYIATGDYAKMQKQLIITDEFAGVK